MTDPKPQLHVVRDTTATLEQGESATRRWVIAVVALVAAAGVGLSLWARYRRDPIARMPAQQRHVLYLKTLDHFAHVCEDSALADDAKALCAEEADLLRRFPDCEQECHDRTAAFAHEHPTR
jgi:hypothetical protein